MGASVSNREKPNWTEISYNYSPTTTLPNKFCYTNKLENILQEFNAEIICLISSYAESDYNHIIVTNSGQIYHALNGEKLFDSSHITNYLLLQNERILQANRQKLMLLAFNNYCANPVTPKMSPRKLNRGGFVTPTQISPQSSPNRASSEYNYYSGVSPPPSLVRAKSIGGISPAIPILTASPAINQLYTTNNNNYNFNSNINNVIEPKSLQHHTNSCKHESRLKIKVMCVLPDEFVVAACLCKLSIWDLRSIENNPYAHYSSPSLSSISTNSGSISFSNSNTYYSTPPLSSSSSSTNSPQKFSKVPSTPDKFINPSPRLTASPALSHASSAGSTATKPHKLFSLHFPDSFIPSKSSSSSTSPTPRLFLQPLSNSRLAILSTQFHSTEYSNHKSEKLFIAIVVLDLSARVYKDNKAVWRNVYHNTDKHFPTSLIRLSGDSSNNNEEQLISEFSDGTIKKWLLNSETNQISGYKNLYQQDAECLANHSCCNHHNKNKTNSNGEGVTKYLPSLNFQHINQTFVAINNRLQLCVHSTRTGLKLYNIQLKLQWNWLENQHMSANTAENTPITAAGLHHIVIGKDATVQRENSEQHGLPLLNKTVNISAASITNNGYFITLDSSLDVLYVWDIITTPTEPNCINIISLESSKTRYLSSNQDNLGRCYDWSDHNLNSKFMNAIEEIDSPTFQLPEPVAYQRRAITQSILHLKQPHYNSTSYSNLLHANHYLTNSSNTHHHHTNSYTTPNSGRNTPEPPLSERSSSNPCAPSSTPLQTTALFDLYANAPSLKRLTSLTLPAAGSRRNLFSSLTEYPGDYNYSVDYSNNSSRPTSSCSIYEPDNQRVSSDNNTDSTNSARSTPRHDSF